MSGADDGFERAGVNLEPTVSVMIPTLNEAGNLPYVLNTIPNWVDEIVLVDGRSSDDTLRIAKVLHPDIRIVTELRPGKGISMQTVRWTEQKSPSSATRSMPAPST